MENKYTVVCEAKGSQASVSSDTFEEVNVTEAKRTVKKRNFGEVQVQIDRFMSYYAGRAMTEFWITVEMEDCDEAEQERDSAEA